MNDEMVERVARAIYAKSLRTHSSFSDAEIASMVETEWREAIPVARAAIEAMREPIGGEPYS